MTSLSFLPLGLPTTHPFWSDAPQPWTSQKAWSGQPFPKRPPLERRYTYTRPVLSRHPLFKIITHEFPPQNIYILISNTFHFHSTGCGKRVLCHVIRNSSRLQRDIGQHNHIPLQFRNQPRQMAICSLLRPGRLRNHCQTQARKPQMENTTVTLQRQRKRRAQCNFHRY